MSFLADKKSMEKRYRDAFERAISRFYADPEYAGNEVRRNYEQYITALKEDFKAVQDFNPQKGVPGNDQSVEKGVHRELSSSV